MGISSVVERGNEVVIYDETGKRVCSIANNPTQPGDGLMGYTFKTVTIRKYGASNTYDEHGRLLFTR